ncbi:RGG repeats nuclear RNA binding protein B [Bienertia sinuspersici]
MMVIGIVEMRSLKCVDVKETRNEGGRSEVGRGGGGRNQGYRRGRGLAGANRDFPNNDDTFANENRVSAGFKEDRVRQTERHGGYGGLGGYCGAEKPAGDEENVAAEKENPEKEVEEVEPEEKGSDKDKRKGAAEKEERAKKSVSINEFLKRAESDGHYKRGGRGRNRGGRGGYDGGYGMNNASAPSIEDPS